MIDGAGNPWFLADVALDGDRIAAIGDLGAATGVREIDATGLYVTPGFIDAHSHAGPGLATAGLSHGEPLLAPWMEGVPHPRSYGTFPRKIRQFVLEEGIVDLAAAIRSMTGLPAQVLRISDRGVLRPGAYADIVVFDLTLLNDPATFTRPHQLAEGMIEVFVNGEAAVSSGDFTGTLAGRVIRKR